MTTATKPKSKPLTTEQVEAVAEALRKIDFQLWFKRRFIKHAKAEVEKLVGFAIRPSQFKSIRHGTCQWFRVERRPGASKTTLLTEKEWERLRSAVRRQSALIQGRTIDEAVAVVSLECKCNRQQLSGLNKELHYWDKPKAGEA